MRRKEREITDRAEMESILKQAPVFHLGLVDAEGPYVVPVNCGYDSAGGCLWFHCAREGRKVEALRRDNRVCVEAELDSRMVTVGRACDWTMKYRSVIAFGRAALVEDPAEKVRGLDVIMSHYGGPTGDYHGPSLERTLLVRIDIESLSGKKSL
ncbi:pyridoxamine 5'-phosphate oxidase family protein [bacterium]|nr:pyridoxamine 5'-phosphate oxidase family protein [bacterium]